MTYIAHTAPPRNETKHPPLCSPTMNDERTTTNERVPADLRTTIRPTDCYNPGHDPIRPRDGPRVARRRVPLCSKTSAPPHRARPGLLSDVHRQRQVEA